MITSWIVPTHGDPLGSVQDFIIEVWQEAGLDGLLVSQEEKRKASLLEDPDQVKRVNPFTPVMAANIAKQVPSLIAEKASIALFSTAGAFSSGDVRRCQSLSLTKASPMF